MSTFGFQESFTLKFIWYFSYIIACVCPRVDYFQNGIQFMNLYTGLLIVRLIHLRNLSASYSYGSPFVISHICHVITAVKRTCCFYHCHHRFDQTKLAFFLSQKRGLACDCSLTYCIRLEIKSCRISYGNLMVKCDRTQCPTYFEMFFRSR